MARLFGFAFVLYIPQSAGKAITEEKKIDRHVVATGGRGIAT